MQEIEIESSTPDSERQPPADMWRDERRFHDLVMKHLGDDARRWGETATQPEVCEWWYVVSVIKYHARRPWTDNDTSILTKAIRHQKRDRKTLNAAAKILEADLGRLPDLPDFAGRRHALIAAIQQLRRPRGAADSNVEPVSQISIQGPAWQGWALVVRDLAPAIYAILGHHQIGVATGERSPLTLIILDVLQFIYPEAALPSLKAISKLLQETIEPKPKKKAAPYSSPNRGAFS